MRFITRAEAQVIEALLAVVPGDEADRVRKSGVPRTTFQTIRRRVLVDGWIQERYVPAPAAVGSGVVRFWLAQPFAERRADVVKRWRTHPGTVILWASPDTVFSVTFDAANYGDSSRPAYLGPIPEDWVRRSWAVAPTPDGVNLPVYFDYEGAWARRVGAPTAISYPH